MHSATETTLIAFVDLLTAIAGQSGAAIPAPTRNQVLPERMSAFKTGRAFLNVLDGDAGGNAEGGSDNVALGAGEQQYELLHEPEVEWIVEDADDAARDATFDAGLVAIYDALAAENAIPGVTVTLKSIQRSNLNTDGLAGVKAASMIFRLAFLSNRPF